MQNSLSFVMCRDLLGKKVTKADNYIECDSDFYKYTILPINLTIFLTISTTLPIVYFLKLN